MKELIEKIKQKKEFSELPEKDIEIAFWKFDKDRYSDEEKVKLTRNLLRKVYSGFGGKRILSFKGKSAKEILEKHLSTRERFPNYEEIYGRLLKWFDKNKNLSVIDLGAGVNGFSYGFFKKIGFKKIHYLSVEAVGQLAEITKDFFEKENIDAESHHESLFDKEKIYSLMKKQKSPKIIFMFKVIDSLETMKRDYTKEFLEDMKDFLSKEDVVVISFATESWYKRKKFFANRKWLIDFLEDNFDFADDFSTTGERYIVFRKKQKHL